MSMKTKNTNRASISFFIQSGYDSHDIGFRDVNRKKYHDMVLQEMFDNTNDGFIQAREAGFSVPNPIIEVSVVDVTISKISQYFDIESLKRHHEARKLQNRYIPWDDFIKNETMKVLVIRDNICGAYGESKGALGRVIEGQSQQPFQALFGARGNSSKTSEDGSNGVVGSQGHGARSSALACSYVQTMMIYSHPIDGGARTFGGHATFGSHEVDGNHYQGAAPIRLDGRPNEMPRDELADKILMSFGVKPTGHPGLTVLIPAICEELQDIGKIASAILVQQLTRIWDNQFTFILKDATHNITINKSNLLQNIKLAQVENWGAYKDEDEQDANSRIGLLNTLPSVLKLLNHRHIQAIATSQSRGVFEFSENDLTTIRNILAMNDVVKVVVPASLLKKNENHSLINGNLKMLCCQISEDNGEAYHVVLRDSRIHYFKPSTPDKNRYLTLGIAEGDMLASLLRSAEDVTHTDWAEQQATQAGWARKSADRAIRLLTKGGENFLHHVLKEQTIVDLNDPYAEFFPIANSEEKNRHINKVTIEQEDDLDIIGDEEEILVCDDVLEQTRDGTIAVPDGIELNYINKVTMQAEMDFDDMDIRLHSFELKIPQNCHIGLDQVVTIKASYAMVKSDGDYFTNFSNSTIDLSEAKVVVDGIKNRLVQIESGLGYLTIMNPRAGATYSFEMPIENGFFPVCQFGLEKLKKDKNILLVA